MPMLRMTDHVGLPEADRLVLERAVGPLTSLQDVVRWGFALAPPSDVADVVIQDEFTHDVILAWRAYWLVFDTT